MVSSTASTVSEYLASLPPERRAVIAAVRKLIRRNLPKGYREAMNFGMITYEIPLTRYPETYNGQPLAYAALAAQKNKYSLYLTCACMDEARATRLRDARARPVHRALRGGASALMPPATSASRNRAAVSGLFAHSAQSRAVLPSASWRSGSAPASSNTRTTSV